MFTGFVDANRSFEDWLRDRLTIVEKDLVVKHERMAVAAFPFLRATYFRWVQTWPKLCPELAAAPSVLGVGDLHVENFGTWRDADSRLVWGVNDFDEASYLPYTSDLVRLATSACLSIGKARLKRKEVCSAILKGYRNHLKDGGAPFLLAEQNLDLRRLAETQIKNADKFWRKLRKAALPLEPPPVDAVNLLEQSLPSFAAGVSSGGAAGVAIAYEILHRQAGLGSLGRQRFVALSSWHGGMLAREAKPLVAPACLWDDPKTPRSKIVVPLVIASAVRCPDPVMRFSENNTWMVRRLAPDCIKIEIQDAAAGDVDLLSAEELPGLLRFMGAETANIHLGTPGACDIIALDLERRLRDNSKWLQDAVAVMLEQIAKDHAEWSAFWAEEQVRLRESKKVTSKELNAKAEAVLKKVAANEAAKHQAEKRKGKAKQ